MKIALFTDTFFPQVNGVSNTIQRMMEYFRKENIEYRIFTPKYDDETAPETVEQYYSMKFFLYPDCRFTFPNFFRINKTFEDFKPDLVHNMTEFSMGLAGLHHAQKFSIPSVSTYTTNFATYLKYYNLEPLESLAEDYLAWFHNQNMMTFCATAGTEKQVNAMGVPQTARFSRGIDTKLFSPAKRSDDFRRAHGLDGKIVFSYVGRISAEKGLDLLIDAYSKLYERHGEKAALVMTGDGPYLEECKKRLPQDTVYTGFLKGEDLAASYASSDIFVCPSSTETFGNVVLEAMASGLAVLGADAGGVGENIRYGETGLTFESGNSEELYSAMLTLLEDREMRDALAAGGRNYALTRTWDSIFSELLEHYRLATTKYTALKLSA